MGSAAMVRNTQFWRGDMGSTLKFTYDALCRVKEALGGPIVVQNIYLSEYGGIPSSFANALYSQFLYPVQSKGEQKELLRLGSLPTCPTEPALLDRHHEVSTRSHFCHFLSARVCSSLLPAAKRDYEVALEPLRWILEKSRMKELKQAFRTLKKYKPARKRKRTDYEKLLRRRMFDQWREYHYKCLQMRIFADSFTSIVRRSLISDHFYTLLEAVKRENKEIERAATILRELYKSRIWKRWNKLFKMRRGIRTLQNVFRKWKRRCALEALRRWQRIAVERTKILQRAEFILRVTPCWYKLEKNVHFEYADRINKCERLSALRCFLRWRAKFLNRLRTKDAIGRLEFYRRRELLKSVYWVWKKLPALPLSAPEEVEESPDHAVETVIESEERQLCNCLRNYSRSKRGQHMGWCTIHGHLIRRLAEAHELLEGSMKKPDTSVYRIPDDATESTHPSVSGEPRGYLNFSMDSASVRTTPRRLEEGFVAEDVHSFSRPLSQRSPPQKVSWWVDANASNYEVTTLNRTRSSVESLTGVHCPESG